MSSGYVYVLEDGPGICKVGFSTSFPTHTETNKSHLMDVVNQHQDN